MVAEVVWAAWSSAAPWYLNKVRCVGGMCLVMDWYLDMNNNFFKCGKRSIRPDWTDSHLGFTLEGCFNFSCRILGFHILICFLSKLFFEWTFKITKYMLLMFRSWSMNDPQMNVETNTRESPAKCSYITLSNLGSIKWHIMYISLKISG